MSLLDGEVFGLAFTVLALVISCWAVLLVEFSWKSRVFRRNALWATAVVLAVWAVIVIDRFLVLG